MGTEPKLCHDGARCRRDPACVGDCPSPAAAPEAPLEGDLLATLREAATDPRQLADSDRETLLTAAADEIERLRAGQRGTDRLREALGLLGELIGGDDPCRLDHHGYCQEHVGGFVEPEDGGCATKRARALLAAVADSPRIDPATFSTNGGAWVADSPQEPRAGGGGTSDG